MHYITRLPDINTYWEIIFYLFASFIKNRCKHLAETTPNTNQQYALLIPSLLSVHNNLSKHHLILYALLTNDIGHLPSVKELQSLKTSVVLLHQKSLVHS